MTSSELKEVFLRLVRLGLNLPENTEVPQLSVEEWEQLKALADEQGLSAIVVDGMNVIGTNLSALPKQFRLEWIGQVLQQEQMNAVQQKAAGEMALMFRENGIRTYVLKGAVIAECYPRPEHRHSVDMDCFVVNENQNDNENDVWERGNKVIEAAGFEVKRDFYKNSTFYFPGLTVENHRFLTPFRGNKRLKKLERLLQRLIDDNDNENRFEGTWLYRPPVMVSALFLIEHAYSHFLHEGLTWRMVLDWVLFCRKHAYQLMANELGLSHVLVSLIYMALQLVISLGFIYLCPNTVLAHWIYLIVAAGVLVVAYVAFMKKYYHLHEEYLAGLKK